MIAACEVAGDPSAVYVWVWLPGAAEPVVAGRLIDRGSVVVFAYDDAYLARPDAIALYLPELPLGRGEITPLSGQVAGCMADAGPDGWGRRVIEYRRGGRRADGQPLSYLLGAGSDRIGALDFQQSATDYTLQRGEPDSLDELAEAAARVEEGLPLAPRLDRALLAGSAVGGARPKAVLTQDARRVIAKFSSSTDPYPVVKAEYVAMRLARHVGIDRRRCRPHRRTRQERTPGRSLRPPGWRWTSVDGVSAHDPRASRR